MHIKEIEAYWLKVPLVKPYHTSLGNFDYFDCVLTVVKASNAISVGESSPVRGYCWEGAQEVWDNVKSWSKDLIGRQIQDGITSIKRKAIKYPFSATPLLTAMELLDGKIGGIENERSFPLVGILNAEKIEDVELLLAELLGKGYTKIKMKVGFSVEDDIRRVREAQAILKNRGQLRVDANQGYNFEEAVRFVSSIEPENMELLEQPFPEGDWENMEKLAEISKIPLGLDESIYNDSDILRAIELKCAEFIKLKLMKVGSFAKLKNMCKLIQNSGLKLIFGNGIASDIGCYQETQIAIKMGMDCAGEMNGFLKIKRHLLPGCISFSEGGVLIRPAKSMVPQKEVLKKYAFAEEKWS